MSEPIVIRLQMRADRPNSDRSFPIPKFKHSARARKTHCLGEPQKEKYAR